MREDFYVTGRQPDLLAEFAEQRLFRGFVAADAALRELPGILTDAARPQQAPILIAQDDTHIGTIAIGINHLRTCYINWLARVSILAQQRLYRQTPDSAFT